MDFLRIWQIFMSFQEPCEPWILAANETVLLATQETCKYNFIYMMVIFPSLWFSCFTHSLFLWPKMQITSITHCHAVLWNPFLLLRLLSRSWVAIIIRQISGKPEVNILFSRTQFPSLLKKIIRHASTESKEGENKRKTGKTSWTLQKSIKSTCRLVIWWQSFHK